MYINFYGFIYVLYRPMQFVLSSFSDGNVRDGIFENTKVSLSFTIGKKDWFPKILNVI